MRTGQAWPHVRLLVSDGSKIFAEGVTGEDGVFQQAYEELASANDVRVFAIADQNAASNVVGLDGLGVARGLTSKGYIYTDRPAYQPGQIVNVRGIVRRVVDDSYAVDAGAEFDLSVFDPRNRAVWQNRIKLGDFGSFHDHFGLPPLSPQGTYRVFLKHQDGQEYQGSFEVRHYELQNVQLTIDSPRGAR
jgi:uncharacterized protein YfaS (alpha-2-macroglobulin family)